MFRVSTGVNQGSWSTRTLFEFHENYQRPGFLEKCSQKIRTNLFDCDAWLDVVLERDCGEGVDGGGDGAQRPGEDAGDEEAGEAGVTAHRVRNK